MEEKNRIKCGKCSSEYSPRAKFESYQEYDFSCPVCGHGSVKEQAQVQNKQILKDERTAPKGTRILND